MGTTNATWIADNVKLQLPDGGATVLLLSFNHYQINGAPTLSLSLYKVYIG